MLIIFFKLLLKRIGYIVTLLLLPIVALVVTFMASPIEPTVGVVGLYLEDSKDSDAFNDLVSVLNDADLDVIIYDNVDDIKTSVMQGKISSGYVINSEFTKKIQNRRLKKAITAYYLDGNTAAMMADELVSSAVIKVTTPYITYNFLKQKFPNVDLQNIKGRVMKYLNSDEMMKITIENIDFSSDKELLQGSAHTASRLSRGIIATVLLSLTVMSAAYISGQLESDSIKLLSTRYSKLNIIINLLTPNAILTYIFGTISLAIVNISLDMPLNIITILVNMIIFTLLLSGISVLLAIIASELMLSAVMPFIVIGAFIFSPTLIDIVGLVPNLVVLRNISPVTIFLSLF